MLVNLRVSAHIELTQPFFSPSTQLCKVLLWAYLLVVQVVPDGVRELGDNTTGTYSMHVCRARLAGRNPCVGWGGA